MAQVAASAQRVPHSRIRELAEIAMSMDGVYKLYFGESNIPTPEYIKRAAHKAMADGFTFYTENAGLPSLRKAVARYYEEIHGVTFDAMANATPIQVAHVLCRERYTIDFDALERAVSPRTKLLLYTSPSNPLGWVATDEEQTKLLDFARRHGLWLMADEVYDRLNYPDAPPQPQR